MDLREYHAERIAEEARRILNDKKEGERMSELKPCPFCGASVEVLSDGRRTWGLARHHDGCLFPNLRNHEISECDFEAWNTRAERTCHNVSDDPCWYECSLCGCTCSIDYCGDGIGLPNHCPMCGAKVERGDV